MQSTVWCSSLIKLDFAELLDDKRPDAGLCQLYTGYKICMILCADSKDSALALGRHLRLRSTETSDNR